MYLKIKVSCACGCSYSVNNDVAEPAAFKCPNCGGIIGETRKKALNEILLLAKTIKFSDEPSGGDCLRRIKFKTL